MLLAVTWLVESLTFTELTFEAGVHETSTTQARNKFFTVIKFFICKGIVIEGYIKNLYWSSYNSENS